MHTQAWYLRRCMSLYNDVCRRPHLPREEGIRSLMSRTDVDLSLYGPCSSESLEAPVDVEDTGCEEAESEVGGVESDPEFEEEEPSVDEMSNQGF